MIVRRYCLPIVNGKTVARERGTLVKGFGIVVAIVEVRGLLRCGVCRKGIVLVGIVIRIVVLVVWVVAVFSFSFFCWGCTDFYVVGLGWVQSFFFRDVPAALSPL